MTNPAPAVEAARRLWSRDGADADAPEDVSAAADRICLSLRTGLGRWIGDEGYRALLRRAIEQERAMHPVIAELPWHDGKPGQSSAAVRAHGAAAVTDGVLALIAALIGFLARVVGQNMAVQLVEQTSSRQAPGDTTEGGRDG
jgi:hypothetical protein